MLENTGEENEMYDRISGKIRPKRPTQKQKSKIIQAKLAALRSDTNSVVNRLNLLKRRSKKQKMAELHPNAEKVTGILSRAGIRKDPESGSYITPRGDIIGGQMTHYDAVRELGDRVGINLEKDEQGRAKVDDSHIHEFLKRTGLVRLQSFPRAQQVSIQVPFRLSPGQMKTIDDLAKADPNLEIGYAIGEDFNKMEFGRGTVRELLREHGKQFGQKVGQAEGTTNAFNMTYDKSKPTKVRKKRLSLDDKILKYSLGGYEKKYRRYD